MKNKDKINMKNFSTGVHNYKQFFKGKKITVMGLGLLGRGVGDAAFLAECGAEVLVTDLKSKADLKTSLDKLKKYNPEGKSTSYGAGNIKYVLGEHRLEDFRNTDIVLKAAGVPLDSVYIKEAEKNNIPVEMSATLFAKLSGVPMVAVTGTRGKTTTTIMIAHILKTGGKKVILGGNVQGVSNLQLLKSVKPNSIAVFELDSWQLQGFGTSKISPDVAVFTTLFPDHMKYYGDDMQKYFNDKANIFKYQKSNDIFVVGNQALPFVHKWGGKIISKMVTPINELPKGWKLKIPGEHNIYDASLAIEVARSMGLKDLVIKKGIESFKGVSGRLELVKSVKGVKYYNDTTATTPEATIAALRALGEEGDIILIAGGSDKGLDMTALLHEIPKYTKAVFLLSGTGTEKIKHELPNSVEVNDLKKTVLLAKKLASKGDIILLSPAFASFGMFKNEYDRGEQFNKIVKSLK